MAEPEPPEVIRGSFFARRSATVVFDITSSRSPWTLTHTGRRGQRSLRSQGWDADTHSLRRTGPWSNLFCCMCLPLCAILDVASERPMLSYEKTGCGVPVPVPDRRAFVRYC